MTHNFGRINNFILIGGGAIMSGILKNGINSLSAVVFTAERFLNDIVDDSGTTFKDFLQDRNLDYYVSDDINTDNRLDKYISSNTICFSISAPWIIRKKFLNKFDNRGVLNIHISDLPRYRGGGGPSWKILNGEREGAYTIHFITTGIDDGEILHSEKFEYPHHCIYPEQMDELNISVSIKGLQVFLNDVANGRDFTVVNQDENLSFYLPRLNTKMNAFIDWSWTRKEIIAFINAFSYPFEGAKTYVNNDLVKIKSCKSGVDRYFHPFLNGIVIRKTDSDLFVAHRDGEMIISEVINENGMSCFTAIKLGDRLITTKNQVDNAMGFRPIYTAKGLKSN